MVITSVEPRGARRGRGLDERQRLVVIAPVALIAITYPVFQLADAIIGDAVGGRLAWFAGMSCYWVLCCGWFSWRILGRQRVWELIRPQRLDRVQVAALTFIIAMAAGVRFLVPGMSYDEPTAGAMVLLAISPFANGVFEELLWRGVYLDVFPSDAWLRIGWASIWFGLWHLVPGSISAGGPHIAMVVGPVFMGLYLAVLAKRTDSVWLPIVAHTLGGLVMIS